MSEQPSGAGAAPDAQDLKDYDHVTGMRARHLCWVDQPLVLITQLPRSGGTLVMRLLDGHPECHTAPHELNIGWGRQGKLLDGAEEAWLDIADRNLPRYFWDDLQTRVDQNQAPRAHPLLLPPLLQRRIFEHCLARFEEPSERDVINSYMTSYFNAWLDNQNLYGEHKRWVTAFAPGMNTSGALERFRTLYPDGRVISVIREPKSWYASASPSEREQLPETTLESWRRSAEATLSLREELGDRLFVVGSDDLATRTEPVMRGLARWLDIRFEPGLREPTLNRRPIEADTSCEGRLSASEQRAIDSAMAGLHREVLALKGELVGESRSERKARRRRQ